MHLSVTNFRFAGTLTELITSLSLLQELAIHMDCDSNLKEGEEKQVRFLGRLVPSIRRVTLRSPVPNKCQADFYTSHTPQLEFRWIKSHQRELSSFN